MQIKQHILEKLQRNLTKYGWTKEQLEEKTQHYIDNLTYAYEPEELLEADIGEFLTPRLDYLVLDTVEDEVIRYPLQDDSGELIAVLETIHPRVEVEKAIEAFRQGDGEVELGEFMEAKGINVVAGFTDKIHWS